MSEKVENITPYKQDSRPKSDQVRDMFDDIAPSYDLMNRVMSFGIDKSWRRKAVEKIASIQPLEILDVATGTGDMAIAMAHAISKAHITGVDLSEGMLASAYAKIDKEGLSKRIDLVKANGMSLPFVDNKFDAIAIAYGIRNFESIFEGYKEMYRVLKPGGCLTVLELSTPINPVTCWLYRVYADYIIPITGRLVSGSCRAYSYLPESVEAVPQRSDMLQLMEKAGFTSANFHSMTFGSCIIYTAWK